MNRATLVLRAIGASCAGVAATALLAAWAPPPGGAATAPAAAPAAPTAPDFRGVDPFDQPRTLDDLRSLEAEVKAVAARVRPTVVLLKARGSRGGTSSGTGVIIGKDGLVATCGHVGLRPGRRVEAVLDDGTQLQGTTLGQVFSGGVDCGLVQLDVGDRELPAAPMGSIVGLAKGDWVLAFGHTHGAGDDQRPALLRVGRVLGTAPHELLMDAPIDAGDSGGPSFNLRGEVVGLNSRCGKQSWENVATPIDELQSRLADLRKQDAATEADARTEPRRRSRPTNFPSGNNDSGKLAAQRVLKLEPVLEDAQRSMLRVLIDGKAVAYGTVVDHRGLAVTKASQLKDGVPLEIETPGRQRYPASVVARDAASDCALLLIAGAGAGELVEVKWRPDVTVAPGTALATPRVRPDAAALGFAAIEERESERDALSRPYLGLRSATAGADRLAALGADAGVVVEQVVAGAAAERAGVQVGDVVLALGGKPVRSPDALRRLIGEHSIGDRVSLRVATGAETREIEAVLAERPAAMGGTRRGNTTTPISRVSGGLGEVLPHDAVLLPEQMGGPLVDLQGRVVGMNIARYDRTATHAIPAARAQALVAALTDQARQARQARESARPSAAPEATSATAK